MKELEKAFKALSNINRLRILDLLKQKKLGCPIDECADKCNLERCSCVTEIAREFNLAQSTISHHLKELYNAGIIKMEKQGLWVYCSLNEEKLEQLRSFFDVDDLNAIQESKRRKNG